MPRTATTLTTLALLGALSPATAADGTVTVRFADGAGQALTRFVGDYCPPKILFSDRIYDQAKVLAPTRTPFTRVQWPSFQVHDPEHVEVRKQDGAPSQEPIFAALRARGVRPLVCADVPPAFAGDLGKIERFYAALTRQVAAWMGDAGADIEIFNEPELFGADQKTFHARFLAAWKGADSERRTGIRIGGAGFCFGGLGSDGWMPAFLDLMGDRHIALDFVSYHIYLDWHDGDSLEGVPTAAVERRAQRAADLVAAYGRRVGRDVPIWLTEYDWTSGDAKDAFAHDHRTKTGYEDCARTLESLLIGRGLEGVDRVYWAQGPGQELFDYGITGDAATFFSNINYHNRHGQEWWTYKAGVAAIAFVNRLPGPRCRTSAPAQFGAYACGGGGARALAAWNRGGDAHLRFAFPDLPGGAARYKCHLEVVDGRTYDEREPWPAGRDLDLDRVGEIALAHEASVLMTISPRAEEEGLAATYFDTADLSGRSITRVDRQVDFDWKHGSPDPRIGDDTFSARWTGSVLAPRAGDYTFSTLSDDGVRLWIDGHPVIDFWHLNGRREHVARPLLLSAGRHDLKLEYFENKVGAMCRLSWDGPGFAAQVVPASALRTGG